MAGTAQSSGLLAVGTTSTLNGRGVLSGIVVISDGTNVATVTVYDNATIATGNVLAKVVAPVALGSNSVAFATPIRCDNGLTIVVSGTGAPQGIIYFGA